MWLVTSSRDDDKSLHPQAFARSSCRKSALACAFVARKPSQRVIETEVEIAPAAGDLIVRLAARGDGATAAGRFVVGAAVGDRVVFDGGNVST